MVKSTWNDWKIEHASGSKRVFQWDWICERCFSYLRKGL